MATELGDRVQLDWRALISVPWRRYEIVTRLSPAEITEVMNKATKPDRLGQPPTDEEFTGSVTADGFRVARRVLGGQTSPFVRHRHSFIPVITGRLEWAPGGTRILLTMRLSWPVLIFWILWMSFLGWFVLTLLTHVREVRGDPAHAFAIPAGMLVFGYLLCTVSFDGEARWAKHKLDALLSGDPRSPTSQEMFPNLPTAT